MSVVRPVILSGGSGTRLWPVSTPAEPKQFIELLDAPLFTQTVTRLEGFPGVAEPIIVSGADHVLMIKGSLRDLGVSPRAVIAEPVGRNTAAACVAAALTVDRDEILVVLPSDHLIVDRVGFHEAMSVAVRFAEADRLVTFGVVPGRPETGYGYIKAGEDLSGAFTVARFTEKPSPEVAEVFLADGGHYWNSGMFVFRAGCLLDEAARHIPDVIAGVNHALPVETTGDVVLAPSFEEVPAVSIDVGVMEKTAAAVVVPLDVGWSDVGSWQSLWEAGAKDAAGNVVIGEVVVHDVQGSYLRSSGRLLAVAGVRDVVVVETPDAVLVVPLEQAQVVRQLAEGSTHQGPD